jgi:hypothetical protein
MTCPVYSAILFKVNYYLSTRVACVSPKLRNIFQGLDLYFNHLKIDIHVIYYLSTFFLLTHSSIDCCIDDFLCFDVDNQ